MAIIEMPKGVTPSMIPEYATPNEWAEAFNVSLRTVAARAEAQPSI